MWYRALSAMYMCTRSMTPPSGLRRHLGKGKLRLQEHYQLALQYDAFCSTWAFKYIPFSFTVRVPHAARPRREDAILV